MAAPLSPAEQQARRAIIKYQVAEGLWILWGRDRAAWRPSPVQRLRAALSSLSA